MCTAACRVRHRPSTSDKCTSAHVPSALDAGSAPANLAHRCGKHKAIKIRTCAAKKPSRRDSRRTHAISILLSATICQQALIGLDRSGVFRSSGPALFLCADALPIRGAVLDRSDCALRNSWIPYPGIFLDSNPHKPPAYLKVHTASCHFLGNGKIRRFGCSLLVSGVA